MLQSSVATGPGHEGFHPIQGKKRNGIQVFCCIDPSPCTKNLHGFRRLSYLGTCPTTRPFSFISLPENGGSPPFACGAQVSGSESLHVWQERLPWPDFFSDCLHHLIFSPFTNTSMKPIFTRLLCLALLLGLLLPDSK